MTPDSELYLVPLSVKGDINSAHLVGVGSIRSKLACEILGRVSSAQHVVSCWEVFTTFIIGMIRCVVMQDTGKRSECRWRIYNMYAIWSNSVSVQEGFLEEETKAQGGERKNCRGGLWGDLLKSVFLVNGQ